MYEKMFWEQKSTPIHSIDIDLPNKLKELINEMKLYALTEEDKWYESLNGTYWIVKNASEEITLDGENYVLYPEVVCRTQAFFEYMMIKRFESKLKELGATYVHCTGMLD